MNYTMRDMKKVKALFGQDFDMNSYMNTKSDFSCMNSTMIAKGLANYIKKYYRFEHYPANFKGTVYDLKYFAKEAMLDLHQICKIFESEERLAELKEELKKNNIKLTVTSRTIKLEEF
ncbi:hypothetical protein [Bacillus multifaciens]|uniref:hypothetical protein n=1 Tax=Bacillus multifaciens TaxID=3068506 RepID=UPI002740F603|nr:hypothetical protein [Bacillus sp. WLY-B-L8]MDP7980479.1 hypothetical protein [Bacillus sp. WLY-B-L8]